MQTLPHRLLILRLGKECRRQLAARNACDPLDFENPIERNALGLPAMNAALGKRRIEHRAQIFLTKIVLGSIGLDRADVGFVGHA